MSQLKNRLLAALGALAVAGGLAACSPESIAENAVEDAIGGDIDLDTDGDGSVTVTDDEGNTTTISGDDGSVTVTDDEGNVFTSGAGLPEDFPDSVPVLDLEVSYAASSVTGGVATYLVTLVGPGGQGRELFDEALADLNRAGFQTADSGVLDSTDGVWAWAELTGEYAVSLTVSSTADETVVMYSVEES